ncbi:hypothetical protein QTO34_002329 [Cnephaeus nilssonii]|uniref:BPTI/Kunitz inhibitor domain-containing protein n=1 Tax=Cnephaeus nilssonii TaxID=3371016 RepID=A0AA40LL52_CNENI|nr:hypothetical protein QTO34_002329 [Eptesicus nilssonii]
MGSTPPKKKLHPQDIISAKSRTLLSALCNTMKPELIHVFMLLLILSLPLRTFSAFMFPLKVRQQLCESGYLGEIIGKNILSGEENLTVEFSCTEICDYPPKAGTCKLFLTRFYYNTLTHLCEPFIFTGCAGNRNNFKQKHLCEYYCLPEA